VSVGKVISEEWIGNYVAAIVASFLSAMQDSPGVKMKTMISYDVRPMSWDLNPEIPDNEALVLLT